MANPTATEVAVGKPRATGGVYSGATSATLPTNATAALHSSLSGLGYVSEDGLTQTKNGDVTQVRAWGGAVVRVIKTTDDLSYSWSFLETTRATLIEAFGTANVSAVDAYGGYSVTLNSTQIGTRTFVFDMLDGTQAIRIVVPVGQIDGNVTVNFVDGAPVAFPVNLIALADSSGNKAYLYVSKFGS